MFEEPADVRVPTRQTAPPFSQSRLSEAIEPADTWRGTGLRTRGGYQRNGVFGAGTLVHKSNWLSRRLPGKPCSSGYGPERGVAPTLHWIRS